MAASYTEKVTDKAQDALNGTRRAASQVQHAIGDLDMEQIRSQLKEVVRMGDEFRRARPVIFWSAVVGVSALLTYALLRPSRM